MNKTLANNRLPDDFFLAPTRKVARALLGQLLVRRMKGQTLVGRIVETEAYVGHNDLASHASRGLTPRTAPMFEHGGQAYIYLIYGMYNCFNITTERAGYPAAVLIRALEPLQGIEIMQKIRHTENIKNLCSGPGKLCQAFDITRALNREPLNTSSKTWIATDPDMGKFKIKTAPRIGVDYAGSYRDKPWRFYIADNQFVSKR